MPEISRRRMAFYAVALCLVVWLGSRYMGSSEEAVGASVGGAQGGGGASGEALTVKPAGGGKVVVHVAGEVRHPGVYRLRDGTRIESAIQAAGGATRRADLDAINLAAKAQDGRQVFVPRRGATAVAGGSSPAPPGEGVAAGGGAAATGGPAAQPIDLNRATLEQLDTLDGIGPATAQKILAYRDEHGGFGSVEELGQVAGIGEKRLAALRERVRV